MDPEYAKPEWLICQIVPVPPLCVRPSVHAFGTVECHDDITHKIADIVKTNNDLKKSKYTPIYLYYSLSFRQEASGAPAHIISETINLLQLHVSSVVDNKVPGVVTVTN
jgi:DNA-directed RNA polymerase II subunit RPB1